MDAIPAMAAAWQNLRYFAAVDLPLLGHVEKRHLLDLGLLAVVELHDAGHVVVVDVGDPQHNTAAARLHTDIVFPSNVK